MDWDDVRFFLTLAREGSLSATARVMQVEHSTVSRRIGQLEYALGVRLFDRFARGWTLTSEGEQLLDQASRMETQALALWRAAQDRHPLDGPVRVSAPPVLLNHWLIPRLAALRLQHPGLRLTLAGETHRARLPAGEADIAVRLDHPGEDTLVARPLGTVDYALYGNRATAAWGSDERGYIGFDTSGPRTVLTRWLDEQAPPDRIVARCSDLETMACAAIEGWGLALLPRFHARQRAGLCEVETASGTPSRPLYLVMHADVRHAPRVRVVANAIISAFDDIQPLV